MFGRGGRRPSNTNIRTMQLFHELKQQFPGIPDHVVSACIASHAQQIQRQTRQVDEETGCDNLDVKIDSEDKKSNSAEENTEHNKEECFKEDTEELCLDVGSIKDNRKVFGVNRPRRKENETRSKTNKEEVNRRQQKEELNSRQQKEEANRRQRREERKRDEKIKEGHERGNIEFLMGLSPTDSAESLTPTLTAASSEETASSLKEDRSRSKRYHKKTVLPKLPKIGFPRRESKRREYSKEERHSRRDKKERQGVSKIPFTREETHSKSSATEYSRSSDSSIVSSPNQEFPRAKHQKSSSKRLYVPEPRGRSYRLTQQPSSPKNEETFDIRSNPNEMNSSDNSDINRNVIKPSVVYSRKTDSVSVSAGDVEQFPESSVGNSSFYLQRPTHLDIKSVTSDFAGLSIGDSGFQSLPKSERCRDVFALLNADNVSNRPPRSPSTGKRFTGEIWVVSLM